MEGIRTPRGEEVIDDTMTLASDPGMGEGPFMLEEFLQAVGRWHTKDHRKIL